MIRLLSLCFCEDREGLLEVQTGKCEVVLAFEACLEAFVVSGKSSEAGHPAEATLDNPTPGHKDEALLGCGELDNLKLDSLCLCGLGSRFSRVALVDESHLDVLAGDDLYSLGEQSHLSAVLFGGGSGVQGQQVSMRVHRQVNPRASLALGSVVPGSGYVLGSGLEGPATEYGRGWLGLPTGGH